AEELAGRHAASRVHELADVGVARCDDAVERRLDPLEGDQVLQAPDVRLGGLPVGLPRGQRADGVVVLLTGDRHRVYERFQTFLGDGGQVLVRLRGPEGRTGLLELLIDLRRLDVGQLLALADRASDVDVPRLQIATGPRVDRRFGEGLNVSRK